MSVQIDTHGESAAAAFEKAIIELDEIVTCHSVGGGSDFILLGACRDLDAYVSVVRDFGTDCGLS